MTGSSRYKCVTLDPDSKVDMKKAYQIYLESDRNIENDLHLAMIFMNSGGKKIREAAVKVFEEGMDADIPAAYLLMADCYFNGIGVKRDYDKALEYYEISAEKGDPRGAFSVGNECMLGKRVKPDYERALKYFLIASDKGDPRGSNGAGLLYMCGKGAEKDLKKARQYFKKAAAKGHMGAVDNLQAMESESEDFDWWPVIQRSFRYVR